MKNKVFTRCMAAMLALLLCSGLVVPAGTVSASSGIELPPESFGDTDGNSSGIELPPIELWHTPVTDAAVPATCTELGLTEGSHCSFCGEVLVAQEVVAALGHDWDEGTVTKEPTETEEGEKTYTCTRCDATKTEPIAKLTDDPCEGYTDVDRKAWYHGAVDFVIDGGYMGSTSTDKLTFEPMTKVSRAMVAQIMYNICGTPAVTYAGKFSDVPNDKWFTPAVEWCAQNGLAAGSNGKFNPNGNVTRQELTVFMMNLAAYQGKDTTGRANLSSFPDADKVPTWAKEEMQWAVSYGLISGQQVGDKTYLNPTAGATRAELAAILKSFLTK